MTERMELVILGAAGFLGRAVLGAEPGPLLIKAVARTIPPDAASIHDGITWFKADLLQPASLDDVLSSGDVVMNAAYSPASSAEANRQMLDNIIEACLRRGVARLVHCSTAVVAGATRQSRVTESVTCVPVTPYERAKLALEQQVLAAGKKGLDVGILRPTAIVGPGGANLLKLVHSLRSGSQIVNYLRACLFGSRLMHLVPVRNVAAALLHVARLDYGLNGQIYHIAADDDPDNNFARVEQMLLATLSLPTRRLPLVPVPPRLLSLLLRLLGRSDSDVTRVYDSIKLLGTGFIPIDSVATAVADFGVSLPR